MEETILKKLKKLMALEEGAKAIGSMEEAANAASKIQNLLIKHNLSMATVDGYEETSVEKARVDAEELKFNKREGQWLHTLGTQLAKAYLCRAIGHSGRGTFYGITFIGEPQNLEIVQFAYSQLVSKARVLCRFSFKEYNGYEKWGTYRRGYLMGFTSGVGRKLQQTMEQAKEDSTVTALVLFKSEAVEKYTEKEFPHLSTGRSSGTKSAAGVAAGYDDGYKANVNKGLGETGSVGHLN